MRVWLLEKLLPLAIELMLRLFPWTRMVFWTFIVCLVAFCKNKSSLQYQFGVVEHLLFKILFR